MRGWWSRNVWKIVILPVIAAMLIAGVSLLRGYLHQKIGFDDQGRPLGEQGRPLGETAAVKTALARSTLTEAAGLGAIRDDLARAPAEGRAALRYLSLAHRHNDPGVSEESLERERRAARELVRRLAPVGGTAALTEIDVGRAVFRLSLAELGWDAERWRELATRYPYGLKLADPADAAVREGTGDDIPVVRADWFVSALLRPPLGGPGGTLGPWTSEPPADLKAVADAYPGQAVSAESAARELGLAGDGAARVRDAVAADESLRGAFGLAPLATGGTVPRDAWESGQNLASPFQELARRLGVGRPVNVR